MSGSEQVKEHGGHGVENGVLQRVEPENGSLDRMAGFAGGLGNVGR
jgi:hypothetical protein